MNRVLDVRRPRRSRRSSDRLVPTVSVLRWPAGRSTSGVFEMFSAQETGRLESRTPESPDAAYDRENVLLVSASRKVAPDTPVVQLSLVNTSPSQAVRLSVKLAGRAPASVAGTVLTAPPLAPRQKVAPTAFDASTAVHPTAFRGAVLKGKVVEVTVPARSVVVLTVRQPASAAARPGPVSSRRRWRPE